jgi:lipopolysaccharide biosynthesis regulator YciM
MNTQENVETAWNQDQPNYFDAAIGYRELGMLDEAEMELNQIDKRIAAQSVPVLALRLLISYSRNDWNKMKAVARKLFQLDPSNPKWPFSDGYATAKIESITGNKD